MGIHILAQRVRRRGAKALLGACAALVCACAAVAADTTLFQEIDPIMKGLSEITGWQIRRKVPAEFISKEQLRGYIERRIHEEVKPEDIRVEELTLKLFGLAPEEFDLRKATIDLISEQAAAFYDPHKRKLSIIETPGPALEQRPALIHELAHALADQQFHLERFIKKGSKNDDEATARQAVMEGQATWLMWAYVNRAGGGEASVGPTALAAMEGLAEASSAQYPALEKAPLYLRESLLFPYTKGLAFQDAVFRQLGKQGLTEVFERAPQSTRQILHPQEYLSREQLRVPDPPVAPNRREYRKIADGTLGEFDVYVLLRQYGTDSAAKQLSAKWRGGSFEVLEAKADKHPLLAYTLVWDSPESAAAYLAAYENIMKSKWKRFEVSERTPTAISGGGDRGAFQVRADGARVTSLEGLSDAAIH